MTARLGDQDHVGDGADMKIKYKETSRVGLAMNIVDADGLCQGESPRCGCNAPALALTGSCHTPGQDESIPALAFIES